MTKKYISYFMTFMILGVPVILKAQNELQEGLNLKNRLKSEVSHHILHDDVSYLDHFSISPGRSYILGVADQTTITEDNFRGNGTANMTFSFMSTESVDIIGGSHGKLNGGVLEYSEKGLAFIFITLDVIQPTKLPAAISYIKYGGRLFRILPSVKSYNKEDQELLEIERFNWIEVDFPLPVWKIGKNENPVRVFLGPNLHAELSVRNMDPSRILKAQYPSLPIDHNNNQAASVSAGWNILVLLGGLGRNAWQVGGTVNAMRERSLEEGLNRYNVTQQGFRVFLASPYLPLASTQEPMEVQFVIGYAKSSSEVDTFVTLNNGSNDEDQWGRFDLPDFDLEEETFYFDTVIHF